MKEGFRQAMAWLHTWTGLVFGWLLFAIFLTGTLSYFKDEISLWMQPEIHAQAADCKASAELARAYLSREAPNASRWYIELPDAREPVLSLAWRVPGEEDFRQKRLDPHTGAELQARDTRGGEFFYRFHFQLQMPYPWGRWLATAAAMLMFVALISGIITHKKIFKDFFTFRPRKGQRTWLDGHNAVGVLVLPFHLMITYSSLVIFMTMVMPAGIRASYDTPRAFFNDVYPSADLPEPAGQPGTLAAFAPMFDKASAQWAGAQVGSVDVSNPGDRNASVTLERRSGERIAHDPSAELVFQGDTGAQVSAALHPGLPLQIAGTVYGLHMGHFAGPLLRWLYFACGLAGTAMIGTGLVIWLGKRRLKYAKSGVLPFELRLVEVLNIASMAGLVLAVAVFFWTNRLLPAGFAGRSDWEVDSFFIAWGLMLLHAGLRPGRRAWVEQLGLAAVLFAGMPLLDALTTGGTPWGYLAQGRWVMAGFDLTCLGSGLFLAWAARKMLRAGQPDAVALPRSERAHSTSRVAPEAEVN